MPEPYLPGFGLKRRGYDEAARQWLFTASHSLTVCDLSAPDQYLFSFKCESIGMDPCGINSLCL